MVDNEVAPSFLFETVVIPKQNCAKIDDAATVTYAKAVVIIDVIDEGSLNNEQQESLKSSDLWEFSNKHTSSLTRLLNPPKYHLPFIIIDNLSQPQYCVINKSCLELSYLFFVLFLITSATMSNFEKRRLDREKRVNDYIETWKRESTDEMVQSLSFEKLITILEKYFANQPSTIASNSVQDTELTTTFAKLCQDSLQSVCHEDSVFGIGWYIKTTASNEMTLYVERLFEDVGPNRFTANDLTYGENVLAKIDFLELMYEEYISPCEDDLYDICCIILLESDTLHLIDDIILNNSSSETFMYVVNMTCENVVSFLEKELPKIIISYLEDMYNRELFDTMQHADCQEDMDMDIYSDFELAAAEIAECIYLEVDCLISLALANAVAIMYNNYRSQVSDDDIDYLITNFASMDV